MAERFKAPRGTFDLLPEQEAVRRRIHETGRRTLEAAGYGRIETPIFEDTELFARGVGESTDIVQKEMFTFEDQGGRSLTLRPEFDTPAALHDYVKQYDIGPGWTFLTGNPAEMDLIRRRLGFYDVDPVADADLSQHTGMIRFGDERRDRWAMSPAASSASQITRSILTL